MQKLTSCVPYSCTCTTSCAPCLCLLWPPHMSIAYCICHFAVPLSPHASRHCAPHHHMRHLALPSSPHTPHCRAPYSRMCHFAVPVAAAHTTHLAVLVSATHAAHLVSATYTTHLAATMTMTAATTPQIYNHHHNATTMTLPLPPQHDATT